MYVNIDYILTNMISSTLLSISNFLPYLVKYLIGYCNFFNQLGYGVPVYIYLYRRHLAKKNKNWKAFYGNSVSNWLLFNLSLFNKFVFSRTFIVYFTTLIKKSYLIVSFWLYNYFTTNLFITRVFIAITQICNKYFLYIWTPLFKRTSYISFATFLKRFSKRK